MATEIRMPKLGMTMEDGKLLEWKKKEKDRVTKGEVLLAIESDKVNFEVESPGSGILAILVEKGEGIPVTSLLGMLAESEEEYEAIRGKTPVPRTFSTVVAAPGAASQAQEKVAPGAGSQGPVRSTPAARELASQKGIRLAGVVGTGPQGRITREDILKILEGPQVEGEAAAKTSGAPDSVGPDRKRLLKEEPMSSMRGAIARRMMQGLQASAQMTILSEWDVTELLKLRAIMNRSEEKNGYRMTIPGLLIALLARILKEMPVFNASVEGDTIKHWKDVNIGVAVALPDGLVAPVVHGADRKTIFEIHKVLANLIDRAQQRKLLPDDMSDGTFTLTNFGSYGGEWGTILLNPPEVAILGIGEIRKKPVVHEDRIVIRNLMPASLTVDHRVIDGATAGIFCKRMREMVENPGLNWAEDTRP